MTDSQQGDSPANQTPLYQQHLKHDGKIVDFGGWLLPVNYGSQIDEHHSVRNDCGMFDVSHMTVSDIRSTQTLEFLSHLLANDVQKIASTQGKALYSCLLNESGGVIDDLIVYYLNDQHCRIVSNASTREKVSHWLNQQAQNFDVTITERPELALLAVQGPNAIARCEQAITSASCGVDLPSVTADLRRFQGAFVDDVFIGRTGYTGEDGLEIIASAELINTFWTCLHDAGVQPCGLGARDTLRLEAGMALYGNELDTEHTPLDSGLAWTVSLTEQREFIGKPALLTPPKNKMIGLVLLDKGVLRGHQTVLLNDQAIGSITSGTFSPTLQQSIALARIDASHSSAIGDSLQVQVRNRQLAVRVVKYPFI